MGSKINALPGGEDEIGRDQHAAPFIALSQQREEHLHLLTILLHIADVIQDETGYAIQAGQFLGQAQFALGDQQPLHQRRRGGPQHGVPLPYQVMTHRC